MNDGIAFLPQIEFHKPKPLAVLHLKEKQMRREKKQNQSILQNENEKLYSHPDQHPCDEPNENAKKRNLMIKPVPQIIGVIHDQKSDKTFYHMDVPCTDN